MNKKILLSALILIILIVTPLLVASEEESSAFSISVCEDLKSKNTANIFKIDEGSNIKIGFYSGSGAPKSSDYTAGLTKKDVLVLYNSNNRDVYVYYGSEADRSNIGQTINSISAEFYNDACSAFYGFFDAFGKGIPSEEKEEEENKPAAKEYNIGPTVWCTDFEGLPSGNDQQRISMPAWNSGGKTYEDITLSVAGLMGVDPALLVAHMVHESGIGSNNRCTEIAEKSALTGCGWPTSCAPGCKCEGSQVESDKAQLGCTSVVDKESYQQATGEIDTGTRTKDYYVKCRDYSNNIDKMWKCILCVYQGNYDKDVRNQGDPYFTKDGTCNYAEGFKTTYCQWRNYFDKKGIYSSNSKEETVADGEQEEEEEKTETPTEIKKVLVIGDSITKHGYYVTDLNSNCGGQITFVGKGISGQNSDEIKERLKAELNQPNDYDMIIAEFGLNDGLCSNPPVHSTVSNLEEMSALAHSKNKKFVAMTITPWKKRAPGTTCQKNTKEVNEFIKQDRNFDYVVDLYRALVDPNNEGYLKEEYNDGIKDGYHPGPNGHKKMAETIIQEVGPFSSCKVT